MCEKLCIYVGKNHGDSDDWIDPYLGLYTGRTNDSRSYEPRPSLVSLIQPTLPDETNGRMRFFSRHWRWGSKTPLADDGTDTSSRRFLPTTPKEVNHSSPDADGPQPFQPDAGILNISQRRGYSAIVVFVIPRPKDFWHRVSRRAAHGKGSRVGLVWSGLFRSSRMGWGGVPRISSILHHKLAST